MQIFNNPQAISLEKSKDLLNTLVKIQFLFFKHFLKILYRTIYFVDFCITMEIKIASKCWHKVLYEVHCDCHLIFFKSQTLNYNIYLYLYLTFVRTLYLGIYKM